MIRTGLDRLLQQSEKLRGRRYGLLSNLAARAASLEPIHLALARRGIESPQRLFGPEHGFYGVEQDMIASTDDIDPWTGLDIVSLYGATSDSLIPPASRFEDLDLLVVDLQDVGCRYYTYAASAIWAAAVALDQGCEVWILDRPNPLGGVAIEGNLPRNDLRSFVGAFSLPPRHGLTLGELSRLEARRSNWPDGLKIWEVEGWKRNLLWSDTGIPWTPPSPNLPSLECTLLYPGLCLVEGTELSEGRGTTRPFQLVGAPGIDPIALAEALSGRELPGVDFVPTYFRPQFQKHAGQLCGGVEVRVTDGRKLRPYLCGVELLFAAKSVSPERFAWRQQPYEFVSEHPAIDLLTGDVCLRNAVDDGTLPSDWIESWRDDETAFREECSTVLLYQNGAEV